MEILGKLGIDIKLLIAQLVNFGLLLWLLKRFLYKPLYKPIIRRIEKDERELEEARIQKEKLAEEREKFQKEKAEEIAQARKKAEDIIMEAEAIAEKIKERTRKETEEEKELEGCERILAGEFDDVELEKLYMIGAINEVQK